MVVTIIRARRMLKVLCTAMGEGTQPSPNVKQSNNSLADIYLDRMFPKACPGLAKALIICPLLLLRQSLTDHGRQASHLSSPV